MSTLATTEPLSAGQGSGARPYAPSWINRLHARIGRLPRSGAWFYLAAAIALASVETIVQWIDGSYPVGTFRPTHLLLAITPVYLFALFQYLDQTAGAAVERVRPSLGLGEGEYERLAYQLTTLPARPALLMALAGVGLVALEFTLITPLYSLLQLFNSSLSIAFNGLILLLNGLLGGSMFYHTVFQLRVVERTLSHLPSINLFALRPLYAFSTLTARTAVGLVLVLYLGVAFAPVLLSTTAGMVSLVSLTALAAITFVAPLIGLHSRLVHEKLLQQEQTAARMQAIVEELNRRVDARETRDMADLNHTLASLGIEESELARVPTWPWAPETGRWVATAILLPLAIWIFQYTLLHLPVK